MAQVVLPTFPTSDVPTVEDIEALEKAILEQIGGVHSGTPYPGNLDEFNISTQAGFSLHQTKEQKHRLVLSTGRREQIYAEQYADAPGSGAGTSMCILVPCDVDIDTVTFWHNHWAGSVSGKVELWKNNVFVMDLAWPAAGRSSGQFCEIACSMFAQEGDFLEFRWNDGATGLLYKIGTPNVTLDAHTQVFAQVWGVTSHVS